MLHERSFDPQTWGPSPPPSKFWKEQTSAIDFGRRKTTLALSAFTCDTSSPAKIITLRRVTELNDPASTETSPNDRIDHNLGYRDFRQHSRNTRRAFKFQFPLWFKRHREDHRQSPDRR